MDPQKTIQFVATASALAGRLKAALDAHEAKAAAARPLLAPLCDTIVKAAGLDESRRPEIETYLSTHEGTAVLLKHAFETIETQRRELARQRVAGLGTAETPVKAASAPRVHDNYLGYRGESPRDSDRAWEAIMAPPASRG